MLGIGPELEVTSAWYAWSALGVRPGDGFGRGQQAAWRGRAGCPWSVEGHADREPGPAGRMYCSLYRHSL